MCAKNPTFMLGNSDSVLGKGEVGDGEGVFARFFMYAYANPRGGVDLSTFAPSGYGVY
jgi:hypothetical protein